MEDFGRGLDAVLGGGLRVGEAVVAVAHEVLEAWRIVRQVVGVRYVLKECLL